MLFALALALKDERTLTTDCYGFPTATFSRTNCIKCSYGSSPHVPTVGEQLPDFTLSGVSLSSLLDRPVVLVWGMFTCPAFQGLGAPFDECSYKDEYELVDEYRARVNFVHLMGPEPHPTAPDTNFDSGRVLMNYWSTVAQPRTWDERVSLSERLVPFLHPHATFLVDTLADNPSDPRNSPVWCTLGQGARTALLVATDGTLVYAQTWFNRTDLASHLDRHLGLS